MARLLFLGSMRILRFGHDPLWCFHDKPAQTIV